MVTDKADDSVCLSVGFVQSWSMNEISTQNGVFVAASPIPPTRKTNRLRITLRDIAGMMAGVLFGMYVFGV